MSDILKNSTVDIKHTMLMSMTYAVLQRIELLSTKEKLFSNENMKTPPEGGLNQQRHYAAAEVCGGGDMLLTAPPFSILC